MFRFLRVQDSVGGVGGERGSEDSGSLVRDSGFICSDD